ncbi:hypothetical protein OG800_35890 [Streptomyces sp. NBC_00445]|uniref:hypothetical protein n=1 Tax=Streptomyces sp. NBC_00445 TaxID=2975745 RepID=UPI002E1F8E58
MHSVQGLQLLFETGEFLGNDVVLSPLRSSRTVGSTVRLGQSSKSRIKDGLGCGACLVRDGLCRDLPGLQLGSSPLRRLHDPLTVGQGDALGRPLLGALRTGPAPLDQYLRAVLTNAVNVHSVAVGHVDPYDITAFAVRCSTTADAVEVRGTTDTASHEVFD